MTVEQGTLISEPRPKLSARDMEAMLRAHYVPETKDRFARTGGVFAAEVGMNGSWGGQGSRRCDALYAGFTADGGRTGSATTCTCRGPRSGGSWPATGCLSWSASIRPPACQCGDHRLAGTKSSAPAS